MRFQNDGFSGWMFEYLWGLPIEKRIDKTPMFDPSPNELRSGFLSEIHWPPKTRRCGTKDYDTIRLDRNWCSAYFHLYFFSPYIFTMDDLELASDNLGFVAICGGFWFCVWPLSLLNLQITDPGVCRQQVACCGGGTERRRDFDVGPAIPQWLASQSSAPTRTTSKVQLT